MKRNLLLLGAFCALLCTSSFAQDSAVLKKEIAEKEQSLANATNSSRSINATLQQELHDLYLSMETALETELEGITSREERLTKEKELEAVREKLNTQTQTR